MPFPRRPGDRETGRRGDRETGRQGDRETGRQGDRETYRLALSPVSPTLYCASLSRTICVSSGSPLLLVLNISCGSGAVAPNSLRKRSIGSSVSASDDARPG